MNRYARKLVVLIFFLTLGCPGIVRAVSFSPVPGKREEKIAKGIREKGETVRLFQSGTGDVRQEIKVGDILVVYREESGQTRREVGRIKVLLYIGDDFLKGEVVDGEAQNGDIARKGSVATLVVPIEDRF